MEDGPLTLPAAASALNQTQLAQDRLRDREPRGGVLIASDRDVRGKEVHVVAALEIPDQPPHPDGIAQAGPAGLAAQAVRGSPWQTSHRLRPPADGWRRCTDLIRSAPPESIDYGWCSAYRLIEGHPLAQEPPLPVAVKLSRRFYDRSGTTSPTSWSTGSMPWTRHTAISFAN